MSEQHLLELTQSSSNENTLKFLDDHQELLALLQRHGVPQTQAFKAYLRIKLENNDVSFMVFPDGRELVAFDVVIEDKRIRVTEDMVLNAELWLGLVRRHYGEVAA